MDSPALIVVVGPTAVGKSEFAIQLAERLDGEIVSADSRLFYRGMDIGTAKPSPAERARVPHHLIDIADPDQTVSLADFQKRAFEAIVEVQSSGRLPLLVGGTGQYVRAVTQGWQPPSVAPDRRLRAALEAIDLEAGGQLLYRRLSAMDPDAAVAIEPANTRRTVRAVEVIFKTGRRFSQQRGRSKPPFRAVTLGLKRDRPSIYSRVDARIEAMFERGFLDEVRALLGKGYLPDMPSMSAIGYRQCVEVVQQRMPVEQAKSEIRRLTRIFVRRQSNWFRETDPTILWLDAADPTILQTAEAQVRRVLRQA